MSGIETTRREFLKRSGATAGAAVAGLTAAQFARAQGANDKIRLGLIGAGGQGTHDLQVAIANSDVVCAAVCDVVENRAKHVANLTGMKPDTFLDFRKLLERKDIDGVIIATPEHWHCIITILAAEAGKDIYVEKPLGHNIAEGRAAANAVAKHNRITQHGTQQLSGAHYVAARELVRSGAIGKIPRVRVWNVWNETPDGIGNPPDEDPPAGMDYDMWLGPAPKRPFNRNRFMVPGYWFTWDYAGGYMLSWTIHHVDTVHWILGLNAPKTAMSVGGKYALKDNRPTPDTQDGFLDYGEMYIQASIYHTSARAIEGSNYGIAFYGTDGMLRLTREGFQVVPEKGGSGERAKADRSDGSPQAEPHMRNFLDCIRSRKPTVAPVAWGHRSTNPLHLVNIAYKLGRSVRWDAERELIVGDEEANKHLCRTYRAPWGRIVEPYLSDAHRPYYKETAEGA